MFRIIAGLQIDSRKAIKTLKFTDGKYIGDPINIVRILNQKGCQEILVSDIGATSGNNPDLEYIKLLADEARVPFAYGGGLNSSINSKSLTQLGVERFVVSTAIHEDPQYVSSLVKSLGASSIAACLELKYEDNRWIVKYRGGTFVSKMSLEQAVSDSLNLGVGEIIFKPIDFDGITREDLIKTYETILEKVNKFRLQERVEVLLSGGFADDKSLENGVRELRVDGIILGSLVCFLRGNRNSILINYPKKWSITS